ncbi:MAG: DNA polymerase IV [Clostridia bacterium]|nr:DNA polymerase IV [Clostridia bacterium]
MKERVILHIDLNNFYASVECLKNQHYRTVPMAVCGVVELRHGIVLAKNQMAKEKGVKTGEPIWQARQKCPNLEVCEPNFSDYLRFSKLARSIYKKYTDKVESFGIDECWLDVTDSVKLYGSGEEIANKIREDIRRELGITASAGVSFNKITAKLASDYKKPDATTVISKENYEKFAYPLKVESLLYVGGATKQKLNKIGVMTIGDLANMDKQVLIRLLGKWGEYLHKFANGLDDSEVRQVGISSAIKSIGNSMTTARDIKTNQDAEIIFNILADSVGARLREHNLKGTSVAIYVKYDTLEVFSRQLTLPFATSSSIEIAKNAMQLFKRYLKEPFSIRHLGVKVSNLIESNDEVVQLDFIGDAEKRLKKEKLEKTVDNIRSRFGFNSIKKAIMCIDESLTEIDNPKQTNVIHPLCFFR